MSEGPFAIGICSRLGNAWLLLVFGSWHTAHGSWGSAALQHCVFAKPAPLCKLLQRNCSAMLRVKTLPHHTGTFPAEVGTLPADVGPLLEGRAPLATEPRWQALFAFPALHSCCGGEAIGPTIAPVVSIFP